MQVRSLSRVEARVVLSLEAAHRDVVDLAGVRRLGRLSEGFARKVAHDLVQKGWLQRVRRGRYLLNAGDRGPDAIPDADPLRVGSHLVEPYYFSFGTAAQLHGLLPRAGPVYYIVSPTRTSFRPAGTARFRFVRTSARGFFGTTSLERRGTRIAVSDVERTVLDCLDRPGFAGGIEGATEVLASAKPRIDWHRLARYARRIGRRSLQQRLGYLADRVRPTVPVPPAWRRAFRARPADGFVPLGPPVEFERRGKHDPDWHVIENVPVGRLFGEVDRP